MLGEHHGGIFFPNNHEIRSFPAFRITETLATKAGDLCVGGGRKGEKREQKSDELFGQLAST